MGRCRDFGSQIEAGCDHPMRVAGPDACRCDSCGVVCTGLFEACPTVWAQGAQPVALVTVPSDLLDTPAFGRHGGNGHGGHPSSTDGSAGPAANGHDPAPEPTVDEEDEGAGWLRDAFDALRLEVEGLRTALADEQAMVATLLEQRADDAGRNAEFVEELVSDSVRTTLRREAADLTADLVAIIEGLRRDLQASKEEQAAALEASTARATAAAAALPAELTRRDAANRKAFRATLNEELQPIVDAVADSIAQSEQERQAVDRKLDQLGIAVASLSKMLVQVTGAVVDLLDGREPGPESAPAVMSRLLGRVVPAGDASGSPSPDPTPRAVSRLPRRGLPVRPGTRPDESHGRRVSLRKQPPDS